MEAYKTITRWKVDIFIVGTNKCNKLCEEMKGEVFKYKEQAQQGNQMLQTMLMMTNHTICCIENILCRYIITLSDDDNNRLISMCIYDRIADSQFHLNITKSVATWMKYKDDGLEYPKGLALSLHQVALSITGATWAFAPPLPTMRDILLHAKDKGTWRVEEVPRVVGNEETADFSPYFSNPEDIASTYRYWPMDYGMTPVYRFKPL